MKRVLRAWWRGGGVSVAAVSAVLAWTAGAAEMPPIQRLWDRRFGGDSNEVLKAVVPLPDGGLLLGGESESEPGGNKEAPHYGYSDIWLVRLDAQGQKVWDQSYGGERDEGLAQILVTADGGFVLFGVSSSPPGGNKTSTGCQPWGDRDLWVVRLDGEGKILWDKTYGTKNQDNPAVTAALTPDGGLIMTSMGIGRSCSRTAGDYGGRDIWLLRLDANGEKLWDRSYGGEWWDDAKEIVCVPDGGFLLCAQTQSGVAGNKKTPYYGGSPAAGDVWLVRCDAEGRILWQQELGGNSDDYYVAALPQPEGGWVVGVRSESGVSGTRTSAWGWEDYWLVRLDAAGRIVWDASFGGSSGDRLEWVVPRPDGTFLLGGWSASPADGNKTAVSPGLHDVWVVAVDGTGRALWDAAVGDVWSGQPVPAVGGELFLLTQTLASSVAYDFELGVARLDRQAKVLWQWAVVHETNGYQVPFTFRGRTADGGFYWAGTQKGGPNGEAEPRLTDYRVLKAGPAPIPSRSGEARLLSWAGLQGRIEADGFVVGLLGEEGATYVVEVSTDLVAWRPWRTNQMGAIDLKLPDLAATNAPMRFYRAREL